MATDTYSHIYSLGTDANDLLTNTGNNLAQNSGATIIDEDNVLSGTEGFTVTGVKNAIQSVSFTYYGNAYIGTTDVGFVARGSNGVYYLFTKTPQSNNSPVTANTSESQPVCFYPGTLIRTPRGEVAVESLKPGDLVLTAGGEAAPVRWIGRQTVSTRFADPLRVLPIRLKAGALGENLPARDLLLSPSHALLVDGVLVQAGALVNGSSIVREHDVPVVFTYYHVELADHSLILAEGVPAETFVDNVDREHFDNWDEYLTLVGEAPPVPEMDLPRAKSRRQVPPAIRQRLEARAAELFGATAAAA